MSDKQERVELARAAFQRLRKRAKDLEITQKGLTELKSVKNLKQASYRCYIVLIVVFLLPVICVGVYKTLDEEAKIKLMQVFAEKVLDVELEKEMCLMPSFEQYLDLFRPPVDCSICENVTRIDIVDDLSKEEFIAKYAYTSRPVLIRNGCQNWRALTKFSFEFFKKVYAPDSPVLQSADRDCQFFPYRTKFESLGEVFNMSADRAQMKGEPWYVGWSNCDSSAANVLRKFYKKPYFLPEDSESSKTDWIFMGCPGYGAHLHIDSVQKPSWQAQIKGRKEWIIEPPPECYFKCETGPFKVIVQPGDIIVLDTNRWFHQTNIIGDDMSITIGSEYD